MTRAWFGPTLRYMRAMPASSASNPPTIPKPTINRSILNMAYLTNNFSGWGDTRDPVHHANDDHLGAQLNGAPALAGGRECAASAAMHEEDFSRCALANPLED